MDDGVSCSTEEEMDSRLQFQICSHNISTSLYEEMIKAEDGQIDADSICSGFDELSNTCFGYLLNCLLEDEVQGMKPEHMQQTFDFMLESTKMNLNEKSLLKCESLHEIVGSYDKNSEFVNGAKKSIVNFLFYVGLLLMHKLCLSRH